MPDTEHHEIEETSASPQVEAHDNITPSKTADLKAHDSPNLPLELEPSAATRPSGEQPTANSEERPAHHQAEADSTGQAVKLCLHVKEDGVYCQIAALRGRPYCYRHLRLRGQQMRIARALAQRQSYHLVLPPLEDMNGVQAALVHVAAALAAGLLERRRAGQLLYALQQAANNLRFLDKAQKQAQAQANASTVGAPPFSPVSGESVRAPQRVVEEYPQFEAEFGLPPGLDLTLPPQVAFPPAEHATLMGERRPRATFHQPLDQGRH
jgi:hypothetical protein